MKKIYLIQYHQHIVCAFETKAGAENKKRDMLSIEHPETRMSPNEITITTVDLFEKPVNKKTYTPA